MWGTAGPGFSSQVQVDVQGGFFTQLLFHNPHSFSLIEAINSLAFFLVFVCHSCLNKCSPTLWLVDFSGS